jgi:hypothetical protein
MKKEGSWVPHLPTSATTCLQSGNQNSWEKLETSHTGSLVTTCHSSSQISNQQPNTRIPHRIFIKCESSNWATLPKENNIQNVRDAKRASTPRGTAHTDRGAWSVANHIALNNALHQIHNQQHAYIVGNSNRLAKEAAKCIKKSC